MQAERFPDEYFEKWPETPITLHPFDPASKARALVYQQRLNELLAPAGVTAELFGSTQLEIAGKGEWEFLIGASDEQWHRVLVLLINHYKKIYTLLDDFAVFGDQCEGYDVEIIPMRGAALERNRAIMDYWQQDSKARAVYEAGKLQHCHSRREYYRWKSNFIADIIESLPDR